MKTKRSFRGGGRSLRIAIPVLGVACIAALAISSASASNVNCHGRVTIDHEFKTKRAFKYHLKCDQQLKAYSIVMSKSMDSVDPEVQVFKGPHGSVVSGTEAYGCEAEIPGNGFGCSPAPPSTPADPGHTVKGKFTIERRYCKGKRLRVWLTATTVQNNEPDPAKPPKLYTASSQPIPINVALPFVPRKKCH